MRIIPNTVKKIGLCLAFATAGLLVNCANLEEEEDNCRVEYRTKRGYTHTAYIGHMTPTECERVQTAIDEAVEAEQTSSGGEAESCTIEHDNGNGGTDNTYIGDLTTSDCDTVQDIVDEATGTTPSNGGSGTPSTGGSNNNSYTEIDVLGNCEFRENSYVNDNLYVRESYHVFPHYAHGERVVETFNANGSRASYQTFDFSNADKQEAKDTLGYVNYDRCARGIIN